jgi:EF hand domain-containing protein
MSIVPKGHNLALVITVTAGLFVAGALIRPSIAAQDTDQSSPRKEKNLAIGEAEAKRLLLLMDKDQNGKVSKQEFMSFMEAEFERLDRNHDGELDVKELTQSKIRLGSVHSNR